MNEAQPLVSIIIPVWNGEASIRACLEALSSQTYPSHRIEIIAVDNGSTDATAAIIKSIPGVRYVFEATPGSYKARNTGLDVAQGTVIAFIDADCVADANWIAAGIDALERSPQAGILAGAIEITEVGGASRSVFLYEKIFSFRQRELAQSGRCVTANWMSPARIFDEVGRFDARLKSGGDWLLSSQISGQGHAVVFVPDMIVRHPTRSEMTDLLSKRKRVAGGEWIKADGAQSVIAMIAGSARDVLKKANRVRRTDGFSIPEKLSVLYVLARANLSFCTELVRLASGGEPRRS